MEEITREKLLFFIGEGVIKKNIEKLSLIEKQKKPNLLILNMTLIVQHLLQEFHLQKENLIF